MILDCICFVFLFDLWEESSRGFHQQNRERADYRPATLLLQPPVLPAILFQRVPWHSGADVEGTDCRAGTGVAKMPHFSILKMKTFA